MNFLNNCKHLSYLVRYCFSRSESILSNKKHIKYKVAFIASGTLGSYVLVDNAKEGTLSSYIGASIRFLRSLKVGMIISLDYYFSMMGLNEDLVNYKPMMSLIHKRAAMRILEGCLINGGTYIKLGQGLVSLSHILPEEYIEILKKLQDKCLTRDISEMYQIIKEDFGKRPNDMFRYINPNPVAAASLAQVFKGETINGDIVAIKVQYIDLQNRFISDVATIDFLLKIIGLMHRDFNFGWVLTDLSSSLKQELDFVKEGRNSERCAKDLKRCDYIYIPKVYWEYCSSVSDIGALKEAGFSFSDIDRKISEAFGQQIFKTGFVHADPHPGNVFIRKKKKTAEIVLLDHGLYQEIDDTTKTALRGMWRAIVFNNHEEMKLYSNMLGVQNYETLAEILTQRPVRAIGFKLSSRITEEEMHQMTVAAKTRFDEIMEVLKLMPRSLLLIIRNLNTIRSITHDHGDPIDRYAILARCASASGKNLYPTFIEKIRRLPSNLYLEFKLLTGRLWVWCVKTYLKTLSVLGRSPDTSVLVADFS
ncbi:hypothetical protein Trydic_g864 [Trypoxylus dichotomus]